MPRRSTRQVIAVDEAQDIAEELLAYADAGQHALHQPPAVHMDGYLVGGQAEAL